VLESRPLETHPLEIHPLEKLSIIIPIFNGKHVLETALEILSRDASEAEIICIDGGSTDGALELAREYASQKTGQHTGTTKLLEVSNHGWAHASNRGFEVATRPIVLTMNSDLFPTRQALSSMTKRLLEHPEIGAVGPVINNPDGTRQWGFGTLYKPNWINITRPTRTNILHGACLMTRRDVLEKIGGFDENFFFYNEEFDWCWRAGTAGYQLEIMPEPVIHIEGASTGKRNPKIQIEQNRGSLYLLQKHFGGPLLECSRRFFQLLGWAGTYLDPRPEFRAAWTKIETMSKAGEYIQDAPFPLSGRGEVKFEARANTAVNTAEQT
jgi:N-acetylglucosaminyl-diphospho-decaprenol L-rhamnosyltransferase